MRHIGSEEDLAQLLAELRRNSGYSYRGLSARTKINPGTLRAWEIGKHCPSTSGLAALLKFYEVTVTVGRDPREEL